MVKMDTGSRGFYGYLFKDRSGSVCSIQESSVADESAIWLGLNNVMPRLFLPEVDKDQKGWIDYPLPDSVHIFGRMELNQEQVKELLPYLEYFAKIGQLPKGEVKAE